MTSNRETRVDAPRLWSRKIFGRARGKDFFFVWMELVRDIFFFLFYYNTIDGFRGRIK